jgi:hypothetical protein
VKLKWTSTTSNLSHPPLRSFTYHHLCLSIFTFVTCFVTVSALSTHSSCKDKDSPCSVDAHDCCSEYCSYLWLITWDGITLIMYLTLYVFNPTAYNSTSPPSTQPTFTPTSHISSPIFAVLHRQSTPHGFTPSISMGRTSNPFSNQHGVKLNPTCFSHSTKRKMSR